MKQEMPPSKTLAARLERKGSRSELNTVAALAILVLDRRDYQPHFLADRAGQESANRMRLPASGFHQFLCRHTARPLQQFQNVGRLAAIAAAGLLGAFERFP